MTKCPGRSSSRPIARDSQKRRRNALRIIGNVRATTSVRGTCVAAAVNFASALVDQNSLLAETVISAAPETPIPTCPGWTMRQLMRHVGRAHRWAAEIIRTKADVSLDPRSVPDGRPPDDTEGALAWLLSGPEVLLDAVTHVGGSDVTVATFDGPHPALWWVRRLLHESTVHRADAVIAAAQRYELTAELAADGIDEWLGRLAERPRRRDLPDGARRGRHHHPERRRRPLDNDEARRHP